MRRIGWLAMWYGGNSYAPGYLSDHAEYFPSLESAKGEFRSRYDGWADIRPIIWDRESGLCTPSDITESVRTPAVDRNAYMDLYPLWDNGEYGEFSKRLEFGPRMGIQVINL